MNKFIFSVLFAVSVFPDQSFTNELLEDLPFHRTLLMVDSHNATVENVSDRDDFLVSYQLSIEGDAPFLVNSFIRGNNAEQILAYKAEHWLSVNGSLARFLSENRVPDEKKLIVESIEKAINQYHGADLVSGSVRVEYIGHGKRLVLTEYRKALNAPVRKNSKSSSSVEASWFAVLVPQSGEAIPLYGSEGTLIPPYESDSASNRWREVPFRLDLGDSNLFERYEGQGVLASLFNQDHRDLSRFIAENAVSVATAWAKNGFDPKRRESELKDKFQKWKYPAFPPHYAHGAVKLEGQPLLLRLERKQDQVKVPIAGWFRTSFNLRELKKGDMRLSELILDARDAAFGGSLLRLPVSIELLTAGKKYRFRIRVEHVRFGQQTWIYSIDEKMLRQNSFLLLGDKKEILNLGSSYFDFVLDKTLTAKEMSSKPGLDFSSWVKTWSIEYSITRTDIGPDVRLSRGLFLGDRFSSANFGCGSLLSKIALLSDRAGSVADRH